MWLFTKFGYFSVATRDNRIVVRSRSRKDLEKLQTQYLPTMKIEKGGYDYQYRGYCTHQDLADAMGEIAYDIDYPNFKAEVASVDIERSIIYSDIWGILRYFFSDFINGEDNHE